MLYLSLKTIVHQVANHILVYFTPIRYLLTPSHLLLSIFVVSCRSFESLVSTRITQVCISIEGFRIVQDESGESTEFKICMLLNNKERIGWKSFKDFEELALACQEFSSGSCIIVLYSPPPFLFDFHPFSYIHYLLEYSGSNKYFLDVHVSFTTTCIPIATKI